ncbi:hypothetical protein V5799_000644 [Amblyomma americanum]|uniref:Uncharacterized protein n=1 Tax=Amblyomma americanum TaxID=6943 RepID=A0AAQ4D2H3_AMBAM
MLLDMAEEDGLVDEPSDSDVRTRPGRNLPASSAPYPVVRLVPKGSTVSIELHSPLHRSCSKLRSAMSPTQDRPERESPVTSLKDDEHSEGARRLQRTGSGDVIIGEVLLMRPRRVFRASGEGPADMVQVELDSMQDSPPPQDSRIEEVPLSWIKRGKTAGKILGIVAVTLIWLLLVAGASVYYFLVDSDDHQSILRWIGDDQSPFRVSEKSILFNPSDFSEGTFKFLGLLPLFVVDDLPGGKRRTRLVVRAAFRRQLLAVLMDPLGPSVFPVLLSWVGFWLDARRTVPRAALMALAFVVLEHQQVSHQVTRAQDHQLRSIDVWYLVCRCFIIVALLQYVLILHTADNFQAAGLSPAMTASPPHSASSAVVGAACPAAGISPRKSLLSPVSSPVAAAAGLAARVVRLSPQETDDACKTLFPLAFLLAALLYAGAFAGPLLTSKDFAKLPIRWAE